jgi:hypothetical protein
VHLREQGGRRGAVGDARVASWYLMNCMPELLASMARFVRCSLPATWTDVVTLEKNPIAKAPNRTRNNIAMRAVLPRRRVFDFVDDERVARLRTPLG